MTLSETELSGRSALFLIFLSRICAFEILRRFSKRIRLCIAPSLIGSHSSIDPIPPDCLVCIESFGYVFGAPLAYLLGVRLVLARRQGKLPREKIQQDYVMCYASDNVLNLTYTK